ncbi:MAG TPA: DNA polymerase III subunit alpha [Streptosporangiaceae bacterium]|jgi:DNA polymerase-3 subunit alpha
MTSGAGPAGGTRRGPDGSFVHLHVHSEYSMLDGAARLRDLIAACQRAGMPAVAVTDHGNVHGAYEFYRQATAAGIKPVIGMEAYLAPGPRGDRRPVRWGSPAQAADDVGGAGAYTHLTLLAETTEGLHNLFRLSSRAWLEGYFRKPRLDHDLLAEHARGLIATTGCPGGEVQTRLRLGQDRQALAAAARLRDIFGPDNVFIEVMQHGLPVEQRATAGLRRISGELALPLVVTNDAHYTSRADAGPHEALLCVQTATTLADPGRFRFEGSGYYLRSPQEMRALAGDSRAAAGGWTGPEWQAGCDATLLIAERADVRFARRSLLPSFPLPPGQSAAGLLREQVEAGLEQHYPGGPDAERRRRAEYELGIIEAAGFCSYFLVVADLISWAREHGVRVGPGRGSAAGSLIAYVLGITGLDPVSHGLVFERFLNPERTSMPDIDIDFDERGRGDVIRYVTGKYGDDRVAQIITFGTIKAKAAVKDSARVLGFPYSVGDRITKVIPPPVLGRDMPLSAVFDSAHPRYGEAGEVRALYKAEPPVRQVIDTARGLEGLIRQAGVHAAGVIMSSEPLLDHIPVWRREADGAVITQFDYPACEDLGLLKMDFLGLRNLTVLSDAVAGVAANRGVQLTLEDLPLDDPAAYRLLARGDSLGVFQMDGGPVRALLRAMRPDSFTDVMAVLALYRPGPMGANAHNEYADRKNGRKPVVPLHPELAGALEPILGQTYGLIVYQEQVMAIAQQLAGYTAGRADLLRRAMGKKKKEILDAEYEPFAAGLAAAGFSAGATRALWDTLIPFADYAFTKAHAAAYGLVSYWTAYLKASYPAEYMAALLTSVSGDPDRSALYLNECRRMRIRVLTPDVNASAAVFTAAGEDIRFGLAAVRNVGAGVVAAITAARDSAGAFTSFADFLRKVPASVCNKRVIESLIKAGAFDSLGHPRRGLMLIHEQAVDSVIDVKRNEAFGQDSLFGDADSASAFEVPVPAGEWPKPAVLAFEREMLGLYVSDHPLLGREQALAAVTDCTVAELVGSAPHPPADGHRVIADGQVVTVGGILSGVRRKVTRQGLAWASATLEDLAGAVEVLVFPSAYEQFGARLAEDAIVLIRGRLDRREDIPQLVAMDVREPVLEPGHRAAPPGDDAAPDRARRGPGGGPDHVAARG